MLNTYNKPFQFIERDKSKKSGILVLLAIIFAVVAILYVPEMSYANPSATENATEKAERLKNEADAKVKNAAKAANDATLMTKDIGCKLYKLIEQFGVIILLLVFVGMMFKVISGRGEINVLLISSVTLGIIMITNGKEIVIFFYDPAKAFFETCKPTTATSKLENNSPKKIISA